MLLMKKWHSFTPETKIERVCISKKLKSNSRVQVPGEMAELKGELKVISAVYFNTKCGLYLKC